jgi:hypothetical protein
VKDIKNYVLSPNADMKLIEQIVGAVIEDMSTRLLVDLIEAAKTPKASRRQHIALAVNTNAARIVGIVLHELRHDLSVPRCPECKHAVTEHAHDCYHADCDEDDAKLHGCYHKYGVQIDDDQIQISDEHGVITALDWKEDTHEESISEMMECLRLFYCEGPAAVRVRVGMEVRK